MVADDSQSFEFQRPSLSGSVRAHSAKTINEVPLSSRLWTNADQGYRYALTAKTGDHWENVMKRIDVYDEDGCRGWREDIDALLVFAGLFSAAVTAFLIESYAWLQPPPDQNTNLILLQIIQQFQNGSNTISLEPSNSAFSVTPLAIRVNVFWFSSLALSLSCAIIGILCKQWLREYRRDAALSPKDALMLRQTRLESFQKWKVDDILSALPLLLQSALVLFFAGILDLLWSLNTIVAVVLTLEIRSRTAPSVYDHNSTRSGAHDKRETSMCLQITSGMDILPRNPFLYASF
ncbi:hypothetical protein BT96DRAFT_385973 [Gymnopus androsaceus JB14]|uniref:DUF6535 domain-containing protein n=1 Tax=Gymnopus androsaceus JB14 TaxID=1447944 RepID=A0A6A4HZV5_9AGAR|nr:hypothetical protein BT96DRAFT_385973 [Gymnopus androsaceus JB14]